MGIFDRLPFSHAGSQAGMGVVCLSLKGNITLSSPQFTPAADPEANGRPWPPPPCYPPSHGGARPAIR